MIITRPTGGTVGKCTKNKRVVDLMLVSESVKTKLFEVTNDSVRVFDRNCLLQLLVVTDYGVSYRKWTKLQCKLQVRSVGGEETLMCLSIRFSNDYLAYVHRWKRVVRHYYMG